VVVGLLPHRRLTVVATYQALLVALLFVLPGALYTWGFERALSGWGTTLTDRLLRFVAGSAVLHALAAPASWWFYRRQIATGRLAAGHVPWWLWALPLLYVTVPMALGVLVGVLVRRDWAPTRLLAGSAPAPRAWDHVFAGRRPAWLRIRLKDPAAGDGGWIFGLYADTGTGPGSYAAGFGHERDLFLSDTAWLDGGTGRPLRDAAGMPVMRRAGLLIAWDQIAYIEVMWT
jgi:hypothetical protein